MSISKVAGIALASVGVAGFAGCASNNQFYDVNGESKAIIEKSVPNGAGVYDSLVANLPLGKSLGDPKRAVVLRDFAVRAQTKAEIDSLKAQYQKELTAKSDSVMFLNAEYQSQKAARPALKKMALDSADNYWAGKLVRERAVDALYANDYLDSTTTALIEKQKADLDSVTNVYQKKLAKTNKTWANKLANVQEADSLKLLATKIAVEAKAAAQKTGDSLRIVNLTKAIKTLIKTSRY